MPALSGTGDVRRVSLLTNAAAALFIGWEVGRRVGPSSVDVPELLVAFFSQLVRRGGYNRMEVEWWWRGNERVALLWCHLWGGPVGVFPKWKFMPVRVVGGEVEGKLV